MCLNPRWRSLSILVAELGTFSTTGRRDRVLIQPDMSSATWFLSYHLHYYIHFPSSIRISSWSCTTSLPSHQPSNISFDQLLTDHRKKGNCLLHKLSLNECFQDICWTAGVASPCLGPLSRSSRNRLFHNILHMKTTCRLSSKIS